MCMCEYLTKLYSDRKRPYFHRHCLLLDSLGSKVKRPRCHELLDEFVGDELPFGLEIQNDRIQNVDQFFLQESG